MITIKVLSESDLPLLMNAAGNVFDNPVNKKFAGEFLSNLHHHMVAAIADDVMVGFASAVRYIHPDKPPELWINEVGVASSHQNQGIGKAMMREMLKLGRSLECKIAWVLTEQENLPANNLYKSMGGQANQTVMYGFDINSLEGRSVTRDDLKSSIMDEPPESSQRGYFGRLASSGSF